MANCKTIPVDRRMTEIGQYWSTTARIVRALQRADGRITSTEIFDACGVGVDDVVERNTFQASLGRLVRAEIVIAERIRGEKSQRWYRITPRYARVKRIKKLNERGRVSFVVNV